MSADTKKHSVPLFNKWIPTEEQVLKNYKTTSYQGSLIVTRTLATMQKMTDVILWSKLKYFDLSCNMVICVIFPISRRHILEALTSHNTRQAPGYPVTDRRDEHHTLISKQVTGQPTENKRNSIVLMSQLLCDVTIILTCTCQFQSVIFSGYNKTQGSLLCGP
jgi:hypothetical protein